MDSTAVSPAADRRSMLGRFLLSLVLAAFFLWLAWRGLAGEVEDERGFASAVWTSMQGVGWSAVVVYALLFLALHLARMLRWSAQVMSLGVERRSQVLRVAAVGYGAILLFPLRLGEFVRPYLLARETKVGFVQAMGTAVVERIIDGLLMSLLLFAGLALAAHAPGPVVVSAGWIALGVFVAALVAVVLFTWQRGWLSRVLASTAGRASPRLAEALTRLLSAFAEGVGSLRRGRALSAFLGWTLVYWGINAYAIAWLAQAFGLGLTLWQAAGVLAVLVVGIMVPAGPGFLGNFQYFLAAGVGLYLPDAGSGAQIMGLALTMHAIQVVVQCGVALPAWYMTMRRATPSLADDRASDLE